MQRYYKQTCNSNIDESATSIHLSHEEPLPYFAIKKHRLSLSPQHAKWLVYRNSGLTWNIHHKESTVKLVQNEKYKNPWMDNLKRRSTRASRKLYKICTNKWKNKHLFNKQSQEQTIERILTLYTQRLCEKSSCIQRLCKKLRKGKLVQGKEKAMSRQTNGCSHRLWETNVQHETGLVREESNDMRRQSNRSLLCAFSKRAGYKEKKMSQYEKQEGNEPTI